MPDRPTRQGDRITIDRGNVTEIYEVAPTHVEQMFRFDERQGPGDLVVRLAVETELAAVLTADGVLEFSNDLGGVRYSRPVVVDANGRKETMETSWHDGAIELRVPEAFLSDAVFPVTIDPTLLSFAIPTGGPYLSVVRPDVAYDLNSDRYAVVYEEDYSATDHDIFVKTIDTLGATVATEYVDFTTSYWAAPKIANNRIASQFLAVAVKTLSGGATVIFGRTISPAVPITMGAQFQISAAELGLKSNPDVGGDPSPLAPTKYLRGLAVDDQREHRRLLQPGSDRTRSCRSLRPRFSASARQARTASPRSRSRTETATPGPRTGSWCTR